MSLRISLSAASRAASKKLRAYHQSPMQGGMQDRMQHLGKYHQQQMGMGGVMQRNQSDIKENTKSIKELVQMLKKTNLSLRKISSGGGFGRGFRSGSGRGDSMISAKNIGGVFTKLATALGATKGSVVPGLGTLIGGAVGYIGGAALSGTVKKFASAANRAKQAQMQQIDTEALSGRTNLSVGSFSGQEVGQFYANMQQHMTGRRGSRDVMRGRLARMARVHRIGMGELGAMAGTYQAATGQAGATGLQMQMQAADRYGVVGQQKKFAEALQGVMTTAVEEGVLATKMPSVFTKFVAGQETENKSIIPLIKSFRSAMEVGRSVAYGKIGSVKDYRVHTKAESMAQERLMTFKEAEATKDPKERRRILKSIGISEKEFGQIQEAKAAGACGSFN